MIRIRETIRTLPYYRPVPLTPLPLIYQREHLFPYATYGRTHPFSSSTPCATGVLTLFAGHLAGTLLPSGA